MSKILYNVVDPYTFFGANCVLAREMCRDFSFSTKIGYGSSWFGVKIGRFRVRISGFYVK